MPSGGGEEAEKAQKGGTGIIGVLQDTPVIDFLAPEPAQLLSRGEEGEGAFC